VRRLFLRRHPEGAVHADRLAVEVVVLGEHQHELRVLVRPREPLRERDARGQRRVHLGPQRRQHRRVNDARRDGVDPDAVARQVAGGGDRHPDDAALGSRVGDLPDLPFVRRDRRGVDDQPALAGLVDRVRPGDHLRGQAQHVEGPDQVDLDGLAEEVELVHSPGRQDAAGRGDARAVHHQSQRCGLRIESGQRGEDVILARHIGTDQPHSLRRSRLGRGLDGCRKVETHDAHAAPGEHPCRRGAHPRCGTRDERRDPR
jgi:hypothetical protein